MNALRRLSVYGRIRSSRTCCGKGASLGARHKKYWYLTSLFLPLTPLVAGALARMAVFDQGAWLWAVAPLVARGAACAGQAMWTGQCQSRGRTDGSAQTGDRYYARLLFAATAMHWAALIGLAYVVSHGHWHWINIRFRAGISAGVHQRRRHRHRSRAWAQRAVKMTNGKCCLAKLVLRLAAVTALLHGGTQQGPSPGRGDAGRPPRLRHASVKTCIALPAVKFRGRYVVPFTWKRSCLRRNGRGVVVAAQ